MVVSATQSSGRQANCHLRDGKFEYTTANGYSVHFTINHDTPQWFPKKHLGSNSQHEHSRCTQNYDTVPTTFDAAEDSRVRIVAEIIEDGGASGRHARLTVLEMLDALRQIKM